MDPNTPSAQHAFGDSPRDFQASSRGSGARITLGILNIIFALTCGCLVGSWNLIAGGMHELDEPQRDELLGALFAEIEQAGRAAVNNESDPEKKPKIEASHRRLEEELKKVTTETLVTVSKQSGSGLRTTGTVALGLQVALLVAGILLLVRAGIARGFAIVVCLGLLVINGVNAVISSEFSSRLAMAAQPALTDVAKNEELTRDITPATIRRIEIVATELPRMLSFLVVLLTFLSSVYPLVALLVLTFSRSLRADLTPVDDPGWQV